MKKSACSCLVSLSLLRYTQILTKSPLFFSPLPFSLDHSPFRIWSFALVRIKEEALRRPLKMGVHSAKFVARFKMFAKVDRSLLSGSSGSNGDGKKSFKRSSHIMLFGFVFFESLCFKF